MVGRMRHHGFLNLRPSSATGAGRERWSRLARSSVALPHQPAPACACPVRPRVIRRGRFSRATFRTRNLEPPRPGRADRFFPLSARRRSWGYTLRRFAPGLGWTRGVNPAAKRIANCAFVRNSSSEAFLPVRAHLPVDRSHVPAPIDFRRGERPPGKDDCGGGRSRHFEIGPASGLRSRVRSVSSAIVRCRRSFLPWALPLAGLSATPAFPMEPTVLRARVRARSAHRVTSLRPAALPPTDPLMGVTASFPIDNHFERLPPK